MNRYIEFRKFNTPTMSSECLDIARKVGFSRQSAFSIMVAKDNEDLDTFFVQSLKLHGHKGNGMHTGNITIEKIPCNQQGMDFMLNTGVDYPAQRFSRRNTDTSGNVFISQGQGLEGGINMQVSRVNELEHGFS